MEFNVSIIADNISELSESFFLAINISTLPNMVSAVDPYQVVVFVDDVGEKINVFVTRSIQMLQYHFTMLVCFTCKSLASINNLPEYTHVRLYNVKYCTLYTCM